MKTLPAALPAALAALAMLIASVAAACTTSQTTPRSPGPCLRAEYRIVAPEGIAVTPDAAEATRLIVAQRLSTLGYAFAEVVSESTILFRVDVPADAGKDRVGALASAVGQLRFVPIPDGVDDVTPGEPIDPTFEPLFGTEALSSVNIGRDQLGQLAIEFRLRSDATLIFAQWTATHIGTQFAIVLDDTVLSAPIVQSAISGGAGLITSSEMTEAKAADIVTILTNGVLPFPVEERSFEAATCG